MDAELFKFLQTIDSRLDELEEFRCTDRFQSEMYYSLLSDYDEFLYGKDSSYTKKTGEQIYSNLRVIESYNRVMAFHQKHKVSPCKMPDDHVHVFKFPYTWKAVNDVCSILPRPYSIDMVVDLQGNKDGFRVKTSTMDDLMKIKLLIDS